MPQLPPARNSDIEVLRAFAILFTLFEHLKALFPWPVPLLGELQHRLMFTVGVDLFFVISGFVITHSLRRFRQALGDGDWVRELKVFWIKRVFRLLPSAWLWLLVPFALGWFVSDDSGIFPPSRTMYDDALFGFLNIANLQMFSCQTFPAISHWCQLPIATGHYWSLSLEEQFYLLLPLLLLLVRGRWLIALVVLLIASQFLHQRAVFMLGWYTRFDGLLWGVLLALCSEQPWYARGLPLQRPRSLLLWLLLPGLLLLLLWWPQQLVGTGFLSLVGAKPYAMSVVAALGAVLVYIASHDRDFLLPRGKLKSQLGQLATWSYTLYLVHLPLFYFIHAFYLDSGRATASFDLWHALLLASVALGASFFCAVLTHHYVELPLREYGRRLAQQVARDTSA